MLNKIVTLIIALPITNHKESKSKFSLYSATAVCVDRLNNHNGDQHGEACFGVDSGCITAARLSQVSQAAR